MSHALPILLLAAAPDRRALVAELTRLRAAPPATFAEAVRARLPQDAHERIAVVTTRADLGAALDTAIERLPSLAKERMVWRAHGVSFSRGASPGTTAFLFPGQGSEHAGMLRALRARVPLVREWFDALDHAARELGERPPTGLIDPPDADAGPERQRRPLLDRERSAQLGTVADLALHDVLTGLGIVAHAHVGHSNGEHPAVIAAGRVEESRAQLCRGFVHIGMMSARLARPDREALISVSAVDRARLEARLRAADGQLFLAMDNCPSQLVVGGALTAVDALRAEVIAWGGIAATLPFSRAYHTPLFADQADAFADYYQRWRIVPGRVPVHSCYNTEPLPEDADRCRQTMTAQWTARVRFQDTIRRLYQAGTRVFIEVGPDNRLTAFVEDILRGQPHTATSMAAINRSDVAQLCHMCADLFVGGVNIDPSRLATLLEGAPAPAAASIWTTAAAVHRRLIDEARAKLARTPGTAGSGLSVRRFSRADDPFVDHHALGRPRSAATVSSYPLPVLPFTFTLDLAAQAAATTAGRRPLDLVDARATRWLALDQGALTLEVDAIVVGGGEVRVCVNERSGPTAGQPGGQPAFEVTARIEVADRAALVVSGDPTATRPTRWTAQSFYRDFAFHGPAFQRIVDVRTVGARSIEAEIEIADLPGVAMADCVVDPAMLDCAGQLVAFWLLEREARPPTFGLFPFGIRRVRVHQPPAPHGTLVRCRGEAARQGSLTEATFTFTAADGSPIVSVDGFAQRLVQFPAWLAARVFGGQRVPLPQQCSDEDTEMLSASWGIWARALAHLTLSADRLDEWYALRGSSADRVAWLLRHADA